MIQAQVNKILSQVEHFQNGDVSKAMGNMGLKYGTNYGVSILQLKELATNYSKNNELAYALLSIDVRESKILASMLFVESKTTIDQLLSISTAINNIELVEQFSRNLFAKTEDVDATLPIIVEVDYWQKVLAFYTASWALKLKHVNSDEIVTWSLDKIKSDYATDDHLMQKGVFMLMQSIAQFNSQYKKKLIDLAKEKIQGTNPNAKKMAHDFLMLYSEE